jgi:hypothetical protein
MYLPPEHAGAGVHRLAALLSGMPVELSDRLATDNHGADADEAGLLTRASLRRSRK